MKAHPTIPEDAAHAVIVPGGGTDDTGCPHRWVMDRLDSAARIASSRKCWVILLSGGTNHLGLSVRPNGLADLGQDRYRAFPIFESVASANYLRKLLPAEQHDHMLLETNSYDTIGNALFARLLFVDPLKITSADVVTSDFHRSRTSTIFRHVFSLDQGKCALSFPSIEEQSTTDFTIRSEKEAQSQANYERDWLSLQTISSYVTHFYQTHGCYCADRRAFDGKQPGGDGEMNY